MSSCALHMGCWVISPNTLIPSRISVLTDQLNSIHRGVRSRECLSHMTLPCGLLEATPYRNTRVNSHSVWHQGQIPWHVLMWSPQGTCPHVISTRDVSSCDLHKECWAISPNTIIPSRISVIIDQLNSIHRGIRYRKCLSHMALPCGLLEDTPSRSTRVNSP